MTVAKTHVGTFVLFVFVFVVGLSTVAAVDVQAVRDFAWLLRHDINADERDVTLFRLEGDPPQKDSGIYTWGCDNGKITATRVSDLTGPDYDSLVGAMTPIIDRKFKLPVTPKAIADAILASVNVNAGLEFTGTMMGKLASDIEAYMQTQFQALLTAKPVDFFPTLRHLADVLLPSQVSFSVLKDLVNIGASLGGTITVDRELAEKIATAAGATLPSGESFTMAALKKLVDKATQGKSIALSTFDELTSAIQQQLPAGAHFDEGLITNFVGDLTQDARGFVVDVFGSLVGSDVIVKVTKTSVLDILSKLNPKLVTNNELTNIADALNLPKEATASLDAMKQAVRDTAKNTFILDRSSLLQLLQTLVLADLPLEVFSDLLSQVPAISVDKAVANILQRFTADSRSLQDMQLAIGLVVKEVTGGRIVVVDIPDVLMKLIGTNKQFLDEVVPELLKSLNIDPHTDIDIVAAKKFVTELRGKAMQAVDAVLHANKTSDFANGIKAARMVDISVVQDILNVAEAVPQTTELPAEVFKLVQETLKAQGVTVNLPSAQNYTLGSLREMISGITGKQLPTSLLGVIADAMAKFPENDLGRFAVVHFAGALRILVEQYIIAGVTSLLPENVHIPKNVLIELLNSVHGGSQTLMDALADATGISALKYLPLDKVKEVIKATLPDAGIDIPTKYAVPLAEGFLLAAGGSLAVFQDVLDWVPEVSIRQVLVGSISLFEEFGFSADQIYDYVARMLQDVKSTIPVIPPSQMDLFRKMLQVALENPLVFDMVIEQLPGVEQSKLCDALSHATFNQHGENAALINKLPPALRVLFGRATCHDAEATNCAEYYIPLMIVAGSFGVVPQLKLRDLISDLPAVPTDAPATTDSSATSVPQASAPPLYNDSSLITMELNMTVAEFKKDDFVNGITRFVNSRHDNLLTAENIQMTDPQAAEGNTTMVSFSIHMRATDGNVTKIALEIVTYAPLDSVFNTSFPVLNAEIGTETPTPSHGAAAGKPDSKTGGAILVAIVVPLVILVTIVGVYFYRRYTMDASLHDRRTRFVIGRNARDYQMVDNVDGDEV